MFGMIARKGFRPGMRPSCDAERAIAEAARATSPGVDAVRALERLGSVPGMYMGNERQSHPRPTAAEAEPEPPSWEFERDAERIRRIMIWARRVAARRAL